MRIIIVGNGKVGSTLAEQLSAENHDVIIIDRNQQNIDDLVNSLDVMGIVGNGASYRVLQEADVGHSDLLIACTSQDEVNLLCCLVARKMGARRTIPRVRNPEYYEQLVYMRDELGLSMSINPDRAAAHEIYKILKFPAALNVETFSNNRIEMAEMRVKEGSPLDGSYPRDIPKTFKGKALIAAVQRGEKVTIPDGNFQIHAGDRLNVIAPVPDMVSFFSSFGTVLPEAKNVMIIGGGRVSMYLARMMENDGSRVKIIEVDPIRCAELVRYLPKAMVICGDGTDQELLDSEGLRDMDAVLALTGMDEENIILGLYVQGLNAGKVVAKVNRTSLAAIAEGAGLETIVSPRILSANQIVSYARAMQNSLGSNIETLHRLSGGAEAMEFRVRKTFPKLNVPLKDLTLKPNILVCSIYRNGRTLIPGGNDVILEGDRVIIATINHRFEDLAEILEMSI